MCPNFVYLQILSRQENYNVIMLSFIDKKIKKLSLIKIIRNTFIMPEKEGNTTSINILQQIKASANIRHKGYIIIDLHIFRGNGYFRKLVI